MIGCIHLAPVHSQSAVQKLSTPIDEDTTHSSMIISNIPQWWIQDGDKDLIIVINLLMFIIGHLAVKFFTGFLIV